MVIGPGDTRNVQWRICQAPVGSLHLCSARAQEGERGWTLLCSCSSRVSQRLHVGTNDVANPADFGVAVDFVDVSLLLAKTILQGFDRDIESDFVSEFKAIGNRLRCRIDANRNAFDLMIFSSLCQ